MLELYNLINALALHQYNALGNVEKVVDANGHETAFTYDVLGRLTDVKNAEGNITSYSYDASGNLLDKTNALGSVTSYHYDEVNQVVESINPMMEKTSFTYDSNGNLLEVMEPNALTTSYAYNADDQLEQIMYGDGRSVNYEFDDAGRRSLMTDSTGKTRYTYDALNRPTSVIDPRGNNVRYEWTATSQRSRIIYPDNSVVTYSYDKLDRISQVTDGQDQTTSYHYDENGRLIDKLLPNAGQSTYTYDGVGQLLEMKHQAPGGALLEQLTYVYDPVGNKLSSERETGGSDEDNPSGAASPVDISDYAYDALDQLVQVQKQNGSTVVYSYDTVGNRLSKDVTEPGITTSERYTYDAANKLTHFEKGNDYKDYTYDLRGNLLEVAGVDSEATLRLLTAKASAKASAKARMSADLSVPESVYSDIDPLAAPILPDAELDSGVTDDVYGVDEALDPASMMKAAMAAGPQILESNRWDASNRLIGNTNSSGDVTAYQYDGDGKRVSIRTTLGDGAIQDAYPSSNPAGTREEWEPQYKKKQLDIYFTNDITMSIPQPLTATGAIGQNWKQSYVYGAGEERISMSYLVSGDASNDWEPTAGASGAGAVASAPKTLYYLSEALGSVIGLEAPDGSISARYQYDEFGVAENPEKFDLNWSGPDNLFGYTSLGYDYYSGYSHAQARDFDSSVGRFINEDTYEGDINDPQTLNLYTYVSNNPLRYVDPSGNNTDCGGAGGGVVGTTTSSWVKAGKGLYATVDMYTGGALNNYVNNYNGKSWTVKQFLDAGGIFIQFIPISAAEGTALKVGQTAEKAGVSLIQKAGQWIKLTFKGKGIKGAGAGAGNVVNRVTRLFDRMPQFSGSNREKLLSAVQNKQLSEIVNELYRPGATVRDGGIAAKLIEEFSKDSSKHLQKAQNRLSELNNLAKSGKLGLNDLDIVDALEDDLEKAISLFK